MKKSWFILYTLVILTIGCMIGAGGIYATQGPQVSFKGMTFQFSQDGVNWPIKIDVLSPHKKLTRATTIYGQNSCWLIFEKE